MNRAAMTITIALLLAAFAQADTVRVLGYIGSHKVEIQAHLVTTTQRFPVKGSPDYLAITEVYPDFTAPVTYDYTVTADGLPPYERSFTSVGFGKLTYFIKTHGLLGDVKITNRSTSRPSRPVLIASVTGVTQSELDKLLKQDKFTIMGMLPCKSHEERDQLVSLLAESIKPVPEYGIEVGFSSEVRYASLDSEKVQAEIAECAEFARRYDAPKLVGFVPWWGGAPNQWSDTPWLTMSSDTLNYYRFGSGQPVYTRSPRLWDMSSGAAINHSASEWAYADDSRSGIEDMHTMPSDLYRVREWGRWGGVNREENDSMSTDMRLWNLRVAYMTGADLYNSYYWYAIGPERFFGYVEEFMTEFPVVKLPSAQIASFDQYAFKMKTPMKLQAFSRIELPVTVAKPFNGSASVGIVLPDGATISSEYADLDLEPGDHIVAFDFTTPAECGWRDEVLVTLYAFDESGRMALDRIGLNPDASEAIRLVLDLRTQRSLSLAVISRLGASP